MAPGEALSQVQARSLEAGFCTPSPRPLISVGKLLLKPGPTSLGLSPCSPSFGQMCLYSIRTHWAAGRRGMGCMLGDHSNSPPRGAPSSQQL